MVKLSKLSPLAIVTLLVLSLATIVIGGNLSQQLSKLQPTSQVPPPAEVSKLRVCPDKWYQDQQPCVYQNSPAECKKQQREYFIINGERKEVENVDVEWMKENCEARGPETVY